MVFHIFFSTVVFHIYPFPRMVFISFFFFRMFFHIYLFSRMVGGTGGNWKRPVNRMYTYNYQVWFCCWKYLANTTTRWKTSKKYDKICEQPLKWNKILLWVQLLIPNIVRVKFSKWIDIFRLLVTSSMRKKADRLFLCLIQILKVGENYYLPMTSYIESKAEKANNR